MVVFTQEGVLIDDARLDAVVALLDGEIGMRAGIEQGTGLRDGLALRADVGKWIAAGIVVVGVLANVRRRS